MLRFLQRALLGAGLVLASLLPAAALDGRVILIDPTFTPVGTATNPLFVQLNSNGIGGTSATPMYVRDATLELAISAPGSTPSAAETIQGCATCLPLFTINQPAVSGKQTTTIKSLLANTQTQLVPANANRIGARIQCQGLDIVNIDETGTQTLNGTILEGTITLPAGSYPMEIPDFTSQTAINALSPTAQKCRVTETNK